MKMICTQQLRHKKTIAPAEAKGKMQLEPHNGV
jgi:hypothetical protein